MVHLSETNVSERNGLKTQGHSEPVLKKRKN